MIDLDSWHEVFSTLERNLLRTTMTAWGVFWGTFMLVAMLGFGNGLESGVNRSMLGFVGNNVYAWGQATTRPHAGLAPGRRVRLDTDDAAAIQRLDGVVAVAPNIDLGGWRDGTNVSFEDRTGNFAVRGEYPDFARVGVERPYSGRFVNELDMEARRKIAVIGDSVRQMLFGSDVDPIGKYISVRGIQFQVVGVTRSEAPGDEGDRFNGTIVVPFTTFSAAFNTGNRVGSLAIRLAADIDSEQTEQTIRAALRARHQVHPDDVSAIGSFNVSKRHQRAQNMFAGIRAFVWFVCVATLMAGALGVSNIMLISVKERTREFGIRKALGATPASIVKLVLAEAAVLTSLAGYLGVVGGVLGLELVSRWMGSGMSGPLGAPSIDVAAALAASAVIGLAGVLAGVAPARHAASIQPVVALRAE
jgi:putative ABC transport system permease protein